MAFFECSQFCLCFLNMSINDVGLLSAVWNNYRNLLGILEGPVDVLFFSSFITDSTSSLLAGKKDLAVGSYRIFIFWFC